MKKFNLSIICFLVSIFVVGCGKQGDMGKEKISEEKLTEKGWANPPCHPNCPTAYYLNRDEYRKNHPEQFKHEQK